MESGSNTIIDFMKKNVERDYREKKKDVTTTCFGLTVYIYKKNS